MKNLVVTICLIVLSLIGLCYVPILTIWSLNNLFDLSIDYNWKTWCSVYILYFLFSCASKQQVKQEKPFWK